MKCYWKLAGIGIKQTYGNRSLRQIFQFPVKTVLVLTHMLHPHKKGKEQPLLHMAYLTSIRHFRNEKGTGAEMRRAIVSGIVTWDAAADFCPCL